MRHRLAFALWLAPAALGPLALATWGDDGPKAPPDARRALVGTWESRRPNDGFRQLKYVTPGHFIWVVYDVEKKASVGTAGGTWTLRGDTYRETIEFAADGWEHLRGKTVELTSKVEGDTWAVRGTLDTGSRIDETWDRAKATP